MHRSVVRSLVLELAGPLLAAALLLLLLSSSGLAAQEESGGMVRGLVTDPAGNVLAGAVVAVEGTARRVPTDEDGVYRLRSLSAGTVTLRAAHLGYATATASVRITAGSVAEHDFVLQVDPVAVEGIEVFGDLTRGQARALNEQRASPNLKYVVSEELFDRYPDHNAAETVQRLPGVSIARDQGEGRYVQLRGMGQELNALTLNGTRIPAVGRNAERSVGLDLIQSSLIEEITITKALRPDMDADALGGVVDFRLKEAGRTPRLALEVGGGLNEQQSEIRDYGRSIVNLSGMASSRFADGKLGLLVSGSYYNTERGSLFESWRYENDEGPGFSRHRITDYDIGRERIGLIGNLDYEYSPAGQLGVTVNWNRYFGDEIRRMAQYYPTGDERRFTGNRVRQQYLTFVKLQGDHRFGGVRLDYQASVSDGEEDWPDITEFEFRRTNPALATLGDDGLDALDAMTDFPGVSTPLALEYVQFYPTTTTTGQQVAGADLTLPVGTGGTSFFKVGGKVTRSERTRRYHFIRRFPQEGAAPTILGGQFGFPDVRYGDTELDGLQLDAPLQVSESDRLSNTSSYDAEERVLAGYLMNVTDWSPRVQTLVGVRVERATQDYTQLATGLEGEGSDTEILPSAHLLYRFTPETQIRAAVTRGLARAPYSSLVPTDVVDPDELEIRRGNPDLDPIKTWNVDLMLERYTSGLGFVGAGVFFKRMEDPIATGSYTETVGGQSYTVFQPLNGGSATVVGFEVSLSQRLDLLAESLRWFGIHANYTFNHSETDFGSEEGRDYPLPNNARHTWNASLTYDNSVLGLSGAVAANYRSRMWEKFEGSQLHNDIWQAREFHLDVSLAKDWRRGVSTYLQLNNLTNEADREIEGEPTESYSRLHEKESYGMWMTLGVRLDVGGGG